MFATERKLNQKKFIPLNFGTTHRMEPSAKLSAAQSQLNLVLGFFSRVDTKLSVVLGIDLAMLGVLSTKIVATDKPTLISICGAAIFGMLLIASFMQLYRGSFPNLEGGHASIVFFREIQKKSETEFLKAYREASAEALAEDYLGQAWRNSKILTMKFDRLKSSYIYMAWAVLPWAVTLMSLTEFK
ncbi:Pycsar system effector family protein [Xanthomonas euvesicatoria]